MANSPLDHYRPYDSPLNSKFGVDSVLLRSSFRNREIGPFHAALTSALLLRILKNPAPATICNGRRFTDDRRSQSISARNFAETRPLGSRKASLPAARLKRCRLSDRSRDCLRILWSTDVGVHR